MSTFAYKALDASGTPNRGEVDADDRKAVSGLLRERGLIVVDIEEKKAAGDVGDLLGRFKKVKAGDLTVATRQLSTMISSGMSLLRALYVLEDQAENEKLKAALVQVRKDVEGGMSFSGSLAKHPDIFNQLYVSMVGAGETGGILEDTLRRVADQLEKDDFEAPGQVGDDVSGGDRDLRAGGAVRADRVPGSRLRERVQGLRR